MPGSFCVRRAQAKECNVRLIDEDGLFSLIAAAPAADTPTPAAPAAAPAAAPVKPAPPASRRGTDASSAAPKPAAATADAGPSTAGGEPSQLWVDLFKPTSIRDLVGNGTLVSTLGVWLRAWHSQFIEGKPAPKAASSSKKVQEAMTKRAVLLSGE